MTFLGGAGSDTIKLAEALGEKLLGRPLQDAEKAMAADFAQQLKGVEDHAIDDITNLEIVVSFRKKSG